MLTQVEADTLLATGKLFVDEVTIYFSPGLDETHELTSDDGNERFLLDLWRGTIRLSKLKYQNRCRGAIILARLDIDGAPHTNPDGAQLSGTHLHLYREGYEDKWAFPLDPHKFTAKADPGKTFAEFCSFCNIQQPPTQGSLV